MVLVVSGIYGHVRMHQLICGSLPMQRCALHGRLEAVLQARSAAIRRVEARFFSYKIRKPFLLKYHESEPVVELNRTTYQNLAFRNVLLSTSKSSVI